MAIKDVSILVVEDERIVAKDIKFSLQSFGYNVIAIAGSGEEAIEQAAKLQPDIVLMDIQLEGEMDGVQAAEQIYNGLNIPVVYLTAHSDYLTLERARSTGPFGYILKPFEEQDLLVTIETALHRYQLEKKLKESERWWATTFQSLGNAVIATDAIGRVKFLNLAAETLTGWTQKDALGRDATEIFKLLNSQTGALINNYVFKILREETVVLADTVLISKDNVEIPIDQIAAPIKDDQGNVNGVVIVFRDIVSQPDKPSQPVLERTNELEAQKAKLERLNLLKDDFLSTVSHELRTPMANIKVGLQMLEIALNQKNARPATNLHPKVDNSSLISRYIEILNKECAREIELINNLLDLQRLEAGVQLLKEELIRLENWLPQLLEPFKERSHSRQLSLQIDISADIPPIVSDSDSLERILVELLNNACKYTPPQERITVLADVQNNVILLSVVNSGVEIPQNELPRVFDQFYRIPSADRWKQGGTGLGLALVKRLVEHLGGSIQVKSTLGQTCFTVELPLKTTISTECKIAATNGD